jgi:hypothetical protein
LSAVHIPLLIDDSQMGDLITVGRRVTFYTVRRELGPLDGRTFDSPHDAAAAVRTMLSRAGRLKPVAA